MTRVLVCRVGRRPVVETLHAVRGDGHLRSMQAIVGGTVTCLELEPGLDLWCNDEALLLDLPLNRVIPTVAPPLPEGWEVIYRDEGLAEPGEPGEWRIHGDFFLARSQRGELRSVTDADILKYTVLWAAEDPVAAAEMDLIRDPEGTHR